MGGPSGWPQQSAPPHQQAVRPPLHPGQQQPLPYGVPPQHNMPQQHPPGALGPPPGYGAYAPPQQHHQVTTASLHHLFLDIM